MAYALRVLRLLAIVVWVGGLVFFAFVEAPSAFYVMGTTRQFAQLINGSIAGINHLGYAAALVLLATGFLLQRAASGRDRKLIGAQMLLVLLMLAAIAYVQMRVVPAMDQDRTSVGGDINIVPADNPTRMHFDSLHAISEKIEGSAIFLGLGVILLLAGENGSRNVDAHESLPSSTR